MSKKSVNLPSDPVEKFYEDYIAAYLQSAGYYVERNVIDRKVAELLELDIVITDYKLKKPQPFLVEIKSGKWGFSDVFKIRGWLDYIGIDNGYLITKKDREELEYFRKKAKELNVDLIINNDLSKTAESLSSLTNGTSINEYDIETWRFAYWVEQNLLKYLNQYSKSSTTLKGLSTLQEYFFLINSGIFFTKSRIDRIKDLYDIFQKHPRISAKVSNELGGNNFDDDCSNISTKHFNETYRDCLLNPLQISTFIEHRSRLAILKNSIDYLLFKKSDGLDEVIEQYKSIFGHSISKLVFLPDHFKETLDKIAQEEYFHLYPVFWQWFIYVFGGFILKDIENEEYELLSNKTGIPIDHIPLAFASYGKLFPIENDWFLDLPNTNIRSLKLFSVPFRGIGANFRRFHFSKKQEFSELGTKLSGLHTLDDMIKWNNLTVELLNKTYK